MKSLMMLSLFFGCLFLSTGCTTFNQVRFPPSDKLFITTGDGDITKPYKPVGHFIYSKRGFRFGFFLLGYIPIVDVYADEQLNEIIAREVDAMGGDAVINLKIDWQPPNNGFLGFFASGGSILLEGTVIKR